MRFEQFPLSPSYEVSENGDVRRIGSVKNLRPCRHKRGGYLAVSLWEGKGQTWFVHQVVAITFHGPRPAKHDAAHIDGNKLNNHFKNLKWATRAENESDKIRHGRTNRGERNGQAKISDKQAAIVKLLYSCGVRSRDLAALCGVTQSRINQITSGRRKVADAGAKNI